MKNINDLMMLSAEMMQTDNKKDKFFVEFYGHVQKIEVRYYENGWSAEPDNKPVTKCVYTDQPDKLEQIEELYFWFKLLLNN
jgi:hypothetical protein